MREDDVRRLIHAATEVRALAYAPYSRFPVGAALLCASGNIVRGCNVENASYGLSLCAERVALFTAIADGEREFESIAVIAGTDRIHVPCGACCQVLAEFCRPDFLLHLGCSGPTPETRLLRDLLVHPFSLRQDAGRGPDAEGRQE